LVEGGNKKETNWKTPELRLSPEPNKLRASRKEKKPGVALIPARNEKPGELSQTCHRNISGGFTV